MTTRMRAGTPGYAASRFGAPAELEQEVWEREMRRVRTAARLLSIMLVALLARALLNGWTVALAVTAIVVVALLVAALGLQRRGQNLEPGQQPPHEGPKVMPSSQRQIRPTAADRERRQR